MELTSVFAIEPDCPCRALPAAQLTIRTEVRGESTRTNVVVACGDCRRPWKVRDEAGRLREACDL